MVRWRGRYYVAFRSAGTHAATWEDGWGDVPATYGRIMLLESADLRTWTRSVILDSEYDDRDPKLLATEERLYVFSTTIIGPARLTMPQETYLSFTEDGRSWCRPVSAYRYNYGFWKPQTHEGVHYVAADVDITPPNVAELDQQVELLSSLDGHLWQPVSVIVRGSRCTETELCFSRCSPSPAPTTCRSRGRPTRPGPSREQPRTTGRGSILPAIPAPPPCRSATRSCFPVSLLADVACQPPDRVAQVPSPGLWRRSDMTDTLGKRVVERVDRRLLRPCCGPDERIGE